MSAGNFGGIPIPGLNQEATDELRRKRADTTNDFLFGLGEPRKPLEVSAVLQPRRREFPVQQQSFPVGQSATATPAPAPISQPQLQERSLGVDFPAPQAGGAAASSGVNALQQMLDQRQVDPAGGAPAQAINMLMQLAAIGQQASQHVPPQPLQGPGNPQGIAQFQLESSPQNQQAIAKSPTSNAGLGQRIVTNDINREVDQFNARQATLGRANEAGITLEQQQRSDAVAAAQPAILSAIANNPAHAVASGFVTQEQADAIQREQFGIEGIDQQAALEALAQLRGSDADVAQRQVEGEAALQRQRDFAERRAAEEGLPQNLNDRAANETLAQLAQRRQEISGENRAAGEAARAGDQPFDPRATARNNASAALVNQDEVDRRQAEADQEAAEQTRSKNKPVIDVLNRELSNIDSQIEESSGDKKNGLNAMRNELREIINRLAAGEDFEFDTETNEFVINGKRFGTSAVDIFKRILNG